MTASTLLYLIALILAVLSLFSDTRLLTVSVILVCIGLLVGADLSLNR